MKFDHDKDCKILAIKVGKTEREVFLNSGLQFQMTLTIIYGIFLQYEI